MLLSTDILNSVAHILRKHTKYDKYFCKKEDDLSNVYDFITSDLIFLQELIRIVRSIANNSKNLLEDVDSHVIIKVYNSVVAKVIGGMYA